MSRSADLRALEARDRMERMLNEGTAYTLGWLLDEVDETRGGMPEGQAIRVLIEERVERYLFSRSEADKVLDMLDRVEAYRDQGGLADTFGLTDLLRFDLQRDFPTHDYTGRVR